MYVGCDPNPAVFEVYLKQCVDYEKFLGCTQPKIIQRDNYFSCIGIKNVEIYCMPAEDVDWVKYHNTFDLSFTSPPYYDIEQYAADTTTESTQCWHRYKTFDEWKNNFLIKLNAMIWPTIKNDGFLLLNIIDDRKNLCCDDFIGNLETHDDCNFLGYIGMLIQNKNAKRDKNNGNEKQVAEPIWVFRKNNSDWIDNLDRSTLTNFWE